MMRGLWLIASGLFLFWFFSLLWGDDGPRSEEESDRIAAKNLCLYQFRKEMGGPVGAVTDVYPQPDGLIKVTFTWHFADEAGYSVCEVRDRKIVSFRR